MQDGRLDISVRLGVVSKTYSVATFRSNVEAKKLSSIYLNLYVSGLYKGMQQTSRIYAYNADGESCQKTPYLDFTLSAGWNSLNITPILHKMNGFGFVKFRVTAVKNWFEISEAYFTELADNWEIGLSPSSIDFSSAELGTSPVHDLIVSNNGTGNLNIVSVISPSSPFSITSDDCSGVTLPALASCLVKVSFEPAMTGSFVDAVRVLSSDADHPSVAVNISGVGTLPPGILSGTLSDISTELPISNVSVSVIDSMKTTHTATTGIDGTYSVQGIASGSYTAAFRKVGYFDQVVSGILKAGETQILDLQMSKAAPAILNGIITFVSSNQPLCDVSVSVTDSGLSTHTVTSNCKGKYSIYDLPPGNFTAIFEKAGYDTETVQGALISGQTEERNVQLTPSSPAGFIVGSPQLDFNFVGKGELRSLDMNLSNIGTGELRISKISAPSAFFTISADGCSDHVLPVSSSCLLTLTFAPAVAGAFTDLINVPSDDPEHLIYTIKLRGTGTELPAGAYFLPDTGQTSCFDGTGHPSTQCPEGQDGFFMLNDLAYTMNEDGTVTDNNTWLMWQGQGDNIARTWDEAAGYCESLNIGGIVGWRLPSLMELMTIVDYEQKGPSIDTAAFPNTLPANYWTSDIDGEGATVISFNYGESFKADKSSGNYVRCVRGGTLPSGNFSDNYDGTTTDWDTGLMWTDEYFFASTWYQALYSCNMMEVGGYTDWRLPNIKEVLSKGHTDCYFDDCFAWSSTTFGEPNAAGDYKRALVYDNVDIVPHDKSSMHMFRCVRSGWGTFKGMVKGMVTDSVSGLPMPSAEVSLTDSFKTVRTALTDANGEYSITDVPAGDFDLTVSKSGYSSRSISDTIAAGEVAIVNVSLTRQFAVNTLGDYGNETVIAMAGDYNAKNPDGSINAMPRQELAKEFFKTHQDNYDFFVIFSNFDFTMPDADAKGFYLEVKNDTQGIGTPLFDNSASFGSNGKLQGIIEMGNIANHITNPADPDFEKTIATLAHEQMHRWGAYVKFKDSSGNFSTALLGKDGCHWSFLFDSDGSVMYGNDWKDNGNSTFTSIGANKYCSPLDLYLMGMYDRSQVPPMLLIDNPAVDPAKLPEIGTTVTGAARLVTIDDIIASEGQRVPDSSASQKAFKVAYVLLTRPNTYTGAELPGIENVRNAWAGRFAALTGGKGSISDVAPSISVTVSSPSNGDAITGPDLMVRGSIINSTGNETGVTVNDILASVSGDQFIANHVPLVEGVNTITITATDSEGNTATSSMTVNATTTGNHIRLTSNIGSGIAPLEATLRIDGSFSVDNSSLSITGPVQPEVIQVSTDEYSITMTIEGTYFITANVTGPDGNTYQDTIFITVMNRTEMDNMLKRKWEEMNIALTNQDIEKASTYYSEETKQIYHDLFNALHAYLPQIAQEMKEIQLIYLKNNTAKYRMRQNEFYGGRNIILTYYVYFVLDKNGVWKIYRY